MVESDYIQKTQLTAKITPEETGGLYVQSNPPINVSLQPMLVRPTTRTKKRIIVKMVQVVTGPRMCTSLYVVSKMPV